MIEAKKREQISLSSYCITCFTYDQVTFSICQSISDTPCSLRNALAFEKGLLPKKPLYAESGLGCGAFRMR